MHSVFLQPTNTYLCYIPPPLSLLFIPPIPPMRKVPTMTRTSTLLSVALLSVSLGACVGAVEEVPVDQSVVGLVLGELDNNVELCSGVVISPRTVLTSAECVRKAHGKMVSFGSVIVAGGELTAETVVTQLGGTADAFGGTADALGGTADAFGGTADAFGGTADAFGSDSEFRNVENVKPHPDFTAASEGLRHQYDIALVFLAEDAPVAPVLLNEDPSVLISGSQIRTYGFDNGVKRQAAGPLAAVGPDSYVYSAIARSADGATAGSPSFMRIDGQDYLVGLQGSSSSTRDGVGTDDLRIDAHLDFIYDNMR